MIYGSVGNGKTTILKAIHKLLSVVAPEMIGGVVFQSDELVNVSLENREVFQELKLSDAILFIDDFGVEPAGAKVYGNLVSPITDLLYFRYNRMLPTIMTSNLSFDEVRDRYGERILDRFKEQFALLYFGGESFRK